MGVPHRGSALADLGSMFATVLKTVTVGGSTNNALLKTLKKASKPLQDIQNWWLIVYLCSRFTATTKPKGSTAKW